MQENNLELQPDVIDQSRNFNDVPGSGGMEPSELVESLLSNEHIPDHLRKRMWVLFGKSTKLTFLKDDDIKQLMLQFELLRLTIIESIPKAQYNEELELDLIQIQMEFLLNLKRSFGSGRMNERELLGSSTTASFTEKHMGNTSNNPGFLDKLASVFK